MNLARIASSILENIKRRMFANAYNSQLNRRLLEIADEFKIAIPQGTDLVALAIKAAHDAGAGSSYAESVAIDAINRLTFTEKTEEEKQYNAKYVKFQTLPAIVVHLKAEGLSFAKIVEHEWVKSLAHKTGISDLDYLKKFYNGEKKPTKNISPEKLMQGKIIRNSVFDGYKPDHGKFVGYWYTAVRNMARQIIESMNNSDKLLSEAMRIVPETRGEDQPGFGDIQESQLSHEDELNKSEAKNLKKELMTKAKRINPLYEPALSMIGEGYDFFSPADKDEFKKQLGLDDRQFHVFQKAFLLDLKKMFTQIGVADMEEGRNILVARRKIAQRILARLAG